MAPEIDEISQLDIPNRNKIWKRISKSISSSKIGAFARVANNALRKLKICKSGVKKVECINNEDGYSFEEIAITAPLEFAYPGDRYLSRAEILDQLEVIEDKFNKQSMILNNFKEKYTKSTRLSHPKSLTAIRDNTGFKSKTTEERFTTIENLVRQIKKKRQKKEYTETRKMCVPLVDILQENRP